MAGFGPVKVAFCLDSFALGGTELNAVRTAEALDPRFVSLSVYHLCDGGPLYARYRQLGIPMMHCPIPNLYSLTTALRGAQLAIDLRRRGIEIVHAHDVYSNIFAVPWARLFGGCRTVASRRWMYEVPRAGLVPLNRWANRFADVVLANSGAVRNLLEQEECVAPERVRYVPNFVAPEAFRDISDGDRVKLRDRWEIPIGAFVAGIVARLSPVKDHSTFLRALSKLDGDVLGVIVGDGPCRRDLEDEAMNLGIANRVRFLGEVENGASLHPMFDVSVLCSRSEGSPNSLLEAMAAARAVVATPVGGVVDLVKDGQTGLVFPVGDADALARAIRLMEGNLELRGRMAIAGRERVRALHHQDVVMSAVTGLYRHLAGHHKRA